MVEEPHPMGANAGERSRWNDERWTAKWTEREALTTSVTSRLLSAAALVAGERVLDVGCGGGGTTIKSAEATRPSGLVVGVDLSEALLELARHRASNAGVTNLSFRVADAQTSEIGGGPFDVALSQFGVMFFDEPVAAFANIRAHLRPGGRFVFACWQPVEHNPWHIGKTLAPFVPIPSPPGPGKSASGPFALGDAIHTAGLLTAAGFSAVRHKPYELSTEASAGAIVDDSQLEFLGVPADRVEEASAAVVEHLDRFSVGGGRYRFPLAFFIFEARNP